MGGGGPWRHASVLPTVWEYATAPATVVTSGANPKIKTRQEENRQAAASAPASWHVCWGKMKGRWRRVGWWRSGGGEGVGEKSAVLIFWSLHFPSGLVSNKLPRTHPCTHHTHYPPPPTRRHWVNSTVCRETENQQHNESADDELAVCVYVAARKCRLCRVFLFCFFPFSRNSLVLQSESGLEGASGRFRMAVKENKYK